MQIVKVQISPLNKFDHVKVFRREVDH